MNVIDIDGDRPNSAHRRKGRGRRRHQGRGHHLRQGYVRRRRRPHDAGNASAHVTTTLLKSKGEEAAATMLFEREPQAVAALPPARNLRQAVGRGAQRHRDGRRLRALRSPAITASPRIIRRRALGLPEIKVGLFPGAGGTQRIARMMPPADALQFLLKGDQLRLDRAKAMKLVDEVVPAADLVETREGLDQGRAARPRRRGTWRASSCPAARSIRRPA